jgi:hypothetical protein
MKALFNKELDIIIDDDNAQIHIKFFDNGRQG